MAEILSAIKTFLKQNVMWAYCEGYLPMWFVTVCFSVFGLKGA
jgi:hypothetical protein